MKIRKNFDLKIHENENDFSLYTLYGIMERNDFFILYFDLTTTKNIVNINYIINLYLKKYIDFFIFGFIKEDDFFYKEVL